MARTIQSVSRRKFLRGDLAMVLIGVLILGAIRLIPMVGTIVWSLASIFGVGVALGVSESLRSKVLDALFGAEEEFQYTPPPGTPVPPPASTVTAA